ncbi:UDP-N-acetylglucosamine 2-epimerase [Fimbriimonas ginsengisoli]|uniref:UDP-N-acetyl-D-glucosamine 2-epimerase, UDP-hydrolysing n=1 Tax=Fimbriimonas ginsengisoli Gsoil 348 TaxID=661478 RepID=A0A068NSY7_FIMGI|nr:UDP-N-acetylglucosamine 2-epimerase [Fimbriimonas ginsengisoli]AIE86638.1 UDP-N-acetyl-D-glucosamine 2-epimerase, UDP-hydrolysing [Fimbriimonas ginsengisoli Gsoil 348]
MKVRVVTVGRSDYGIYQPLLKALHKDPEIDLGLYVSGMHLSPEHGYTVRFVEADGYTIVERIEMLLANDSADAVAKSMGLGMMGFAQSFAREKPDWLVVLGDRFETFAAAAASVPFKIPLAHLHGGEATFGAIDEAFRHSISKMAHLHFAATEAYGRRLVQMGEEPWRVHVTGALALDNIRTLEPMSRQELETTFGIDLGEPPLLVTFHPVTLQIEHAQAHIDALFAALQDSGLPVIFTLANADTGGRMINARIQEAVAERPNFRLVENFRMRGYFSVLPYVRAMVGNTSSGILEAGAFGLPVVNIGDRQAGRIRGENVLDVAPEREAIAEAIRLAVSPEFRAIAAAANHPYGGGGAAEKMVSAIKATQIDERLLEKRFYDLS